jgi:hypothetical protein
MLKHQSFDKVSVDVYQENRQFFAAVDFAESKHSLGPTSTRDEMYQLIFSFIADLRLIAELNHSRHDKARTNG